MYPLSDYHVRIMHISVYSALLGHSLQSFFMRVSLICARSGQVRKCSLFSVQYEHILSIFCWSGLSMSLSLNLSGLHIAGLMFYSSSGQVDEGLNESDASLHRYRAGHTHPNPTAHKHTLRALAELVIITFSLLPC